MGNLLAAPPAHLDCPIPHRGPKLCPEFPPYFVHSLVTEGRPPRALTSNSHFQIGSLRVETVITLLKHRVELPMYFLSVKNGGAQFRRLAV